MSAMIDEDSLIRAFYSFKKQLKFCSMSDGWDFENIRN